MIVADSGSGLNASVLVLNRYYMAVHVVSVRRALRLLYCDIAEVVHVEDGQYSNYSFDAWREVSELMAESKGEHDDWLRCVSFELQVPRIIRLSTFAKVPKPTLRLTRRNLFARDDHRCQYCGDSFGTSELSIDHVLPRSRGGDTSWENVVASCLRCNSKKGSRTPKEAGMSLIRHPYRPSQNPLLAMKLGNPKYHAWRNFLRNAHPVHAA